MDASGRNAIVTLLANLLSERLDEEQLAAAASVITQLGTTLGFLAAQRALDATRNLNAAQRQALSSDLAEDGTQSPQHNIETKPEDHTPHFFMRAGPTQLFLTAWCSGFLPAFDNPAFLAPYKEAVTRNSTYRESDTY